VSVRFPDPAVGGFLLIALYPSIRMRFWRLVTLKSRL
jgi:hypothetical protein